MPPISTTKSRLTETAKTDLANDILYMIFTGMGDPLGLSHNTRKDNGNETGFRFFLFMQIRITLESLTHICCGNAILPRSGGSKCCEGVQYFNRKQGCCGGKVFLKSTHNCCNGEIEEIGNGYCCGNEIIPLFSNKKCCKGYYLKYNILR